MPLHLNANRNRKVIADPHVHVLALSVDEELRLWVSIETLLGMVSDPLPSDGPNTSNGLLVFPNVDISLDANAQSPDSAG